MPRFDLRQDEESLKPLAAFQVLAVMCRPMDRIKRERMMGDIEATSGMAAPRRRPFSSEEFRREVRLSALKAGVAGGLLLTRLQLHRRHLAKRCKHPPMAPQPAQNARRLRGVQIRR